jgi:hypothetical protein
MINLAKLTSNLKVKKSSGRTISLILILFILLAKVCVAQEKNVLKEMIWGKEYKIEKSDKGYWVYWGDEKYFWEPKPWQQKELAAQGPAYYNIWAAPKLPYPWDLTLEEREKLNGKEFMMRGNEAIGNYFEMNHDKLDTFMTVLFAPDGTQRMHKGIEFWRPLVYLYGGYPKEEGKILKKYVYIENYPEDVRGLAGLDIEYSGAKEDDSYLYLPSVRKVRRMSIGNRQDFFPGVIMRNEDFFLWKPIHNYKKIRTELLKNIGEKEYQFCLNPEANHNVFRGCEMLDGLGEPCVDRKSVV